MKSGREEFFQTFYYLNILNEMRYERRKIEGVTSCGYLVNCGDYFICSPALFLLLHRELKIDEIFVILEATPFLIIVWLYLLFMALTLLHRIYDITDTDKKEIEIMTINVYMGELR